MSVLLSLLAAAALAQEPKLIGSVVRSDRWNIKRGEHKVEEFTGNVSYRREGRVLRSDWALYNHDTKVVEARGDVRAEERLEDGSVASASGERARHDRSTGRGWLVGKGPGDPVPLRLSHPDGGPRGKGAARRLAWDLQAAEVRLEGDAWFEEERGTARAETARFLHGTKRLELSGRRPTMSALGPDWSAAVQADSLAATALEGARRKVTGSGRAHGWIHFPGKGGFAP